MIKLPREGTMVNVEPLQACIGTVSIKLIKGIVTIN